MCVRRSGMLCCKGLGLGALLTTLALLAYEVAWTPVVPLLADPKEVPGVVQQLLES